MKAGGFRRILERCFRKVCQKCFGTQNLIAKIGFLNVKIKRSPNVNKTFSRRFDSLILLPEKVNCSYFWSSAAPPPPPQKKKKKKSWAVTCDFQQCGILTSVDSDWSEALLVAHTILLKISRTGPTSFSINSSRNTISVNLFQSRSDPSIFRVWSGSKLFKRLMIFLEDLGKG